MSPSRCHLPPANWHCYLPPDNWQLPIVTCHLPPATCQLPIAIFLLPTCHQLKRVSKVSETIYQKKLTKANLYRNKSFKNEFPTKLAQETFSQKIPNYKNKLNLRTNKNNYRDFWLRLKGFTVGYARPYHCCQRHSRATVLLVYLECNSCPDWEISCPATVWTSLALYNILQILDTWRSAWISLRISNNWVKYSKL